MMAGLSPTFKARQSRSVARGICRVDIAIVNGYLHGYEIMIVTIMAIGT
jgi:hypothetical protein